MLNGSCACGAVTYAIDGPLLGPITYCHCWRCRKHSGSSFGTTAGVATDHFTIESGGDRLSSWESSPGVRRFFASCCGSPLYKESDETPQLLGFRMGTLDRDPERTGEVHILVDSKVPWLELTDDLPRKTGGATFGSKD